MDHALAEAIRRAEEYKKEGNELFKAKDYANSIVMYTNAINLDPENAVYFSNRSAAYLASKDGRGKALKDGIQCIELKPNWVKGYLRKGAAEHALERFKEAMDTYNLGLAIDPENTSLLEAMNMVRVLYEKKQKKEMEMEKRKEEEHLEKLKNKTAAEFEEDDLLADFMNEVEEIEVKVHKNPEKELVDLIDFGSGERQVARLTQDHFQWINLNPFNVMMLEIDATEDTIKQHYKKLSTLVHPDKCRVENAREAFEEVKKAYQLLLDEKKRKLIVQTVLNARARVKKERRMKIKKGEKESALGDVKEAYRLEEMKAFADIENRRRNYIEREGQLRQRELIKEDHQKAKVVIDYEAERKWANKERRDKRIGNWRGFQKEGKRAKSGVASWKEEHREVKEHGVVNVDEYKKKWK